MANDLFGDRMKLYEMAEAGRMFMPRLPICIRLDGRSFSSWTRGLERPYDARLHNLMVLVTHALVEETGATVGYTESDEISLLLFSDDPKTQVWFGGRIQKIVSTAAAVASAVFNGNCPQFIPDKGMATFDCRAWQVPNLEEAVNVLLWREFDAVKNSIQQAARHYYSHSELLDKHTGEMQEMLHVKGVNWHDYPTWFKRGNYVQRRKTERKFTVAELEKLPPKHQARSNPDLVVERHDVVDLDMPILSRVTNRVNVLVYGADPIVASD
jgi:tRNA(His) 5'-end guanylyltransferase